MCGIAGFFRTHATPGGFQRLGLQVDALSHRGPDGRGLLHIKPGHIHLERDAIDPQGLRRRIDNPPKIVAPTRDPLEMGMGIRRLAIVDLAGGHAPHFTEMGDVAVVLNGEIYNHQSLRAGLEARGHHLRTTCDTEVIAHLYEDYGIEGVLAQIEGMYGLALWDAKTKHLYLARDPLGIKSLYLAKQPIAGGGEQLWFASELQGILADPEFDRRLNPTGVAQLLLTENIPAPHCIMQGVEKLGPGHYLNLSVTGSSLKMRRGTHYHLPRRGPDSPTDLPPFADIKGWRRYIDAHLRQAVLRRIPQEVGVASMLSGGIDSGLVSAYLAEAIPQELETFSVGFEDPRFDESQRAQTVAKHLGVRHHRVMLKEQDLLDSIQRIGQHQAEPLGDHSLVPTWLLAQTIREAGYPVALSGDGGDELFAGYPTYVAKRLDPLVDRLPKALLTHALGRLDDLPVTGGNFAWDTKIRLILEGGLESPHWRRQARWMGVMSEGSLQDYLSPEIKAHLKAIGADPFLERAEFDRLHENRPALERAQLQDLRFYMQDGILIKVDRASMASSLEVRVPILDTHVVAAALSMPWQWRIVKQQTKWILRQIAQEKLPSSIVNGPKKGFGMPTSSWLRRLGRPTLMDLLSPPDGHPPLLNQKAIHQAIDAHLNGKRDHRRLLFTVIMLRQWQKSPWAASTY